MASPSPVVILTLNKVKRKNLAALMTGSTKHSRCFLPAPCPKIASALYAQQWQIRALFQRTNEGCAWQ